MSRRENKSRPETASGFLRQAAGPALAAASAWVDDRRAVSAIEFAFVCPILIALLLGTAEAARYLNFTWKIGNVAQTVASLVSRNQTGSVKTSDLFFANDSAMLIFPDILADAKSRGTQWYSNITVTISSVIFSKSDSSCTTNCSYQAFVGWSYGANQRPCSAPMTSVADTDDVTRTTLPADTFGPGSLMVVEIGYYYTPIIGKSIIGSKWIIRSVYLAPRYVPKISYDPSEGYVATVCPGS
jgi:Flp pilus assembly protein TadG